MASSATSTPTPTTPTPTPTPTSPTTTSTTSTPTSPTTTTSTTTTSSSSDNTPTSPPPQTTTANEGTTTTPNPGTSNGSTPGSSSTDTSLTAETSSITTLSVASTSVMEAVTLATSSDGVVYTTTVAVTTTIPPGTVVTAPVIATPPSGNNRTSAGPIIGGVVGGLAALIILAVLLFFCLRKRRKDEFDGNFDPAHVTSGGGGGGTLPKIDLGEGGLIGSNGVGVEEDDGMGGRLGAGAGGGGIITPYAFQPAPVGGTAIGGGQQYQNQPQMQQMSNIGVAADGVGAASAAGYPNEKRALRQQNAQHTPNPSVSSGSLYPSSSNRNPQMNPNGVSPEPYSATSDGSSSVGGSGSGGIYYQSMGRGPSPGPSVLSSSSGGRNAKEMEAMGRVIANPDERGQQLAAFQQAYLQTGPGPHQQQQPYMSSSSSTAVPSQSSGVSRAGTAVVVHADGGRVVLRKGEEAEGEREVLSPEIPPTYDSLPSDVRRDS